MTEDTLTLQCKQHQEMTPHTRLDTIGLTCLPCLAIYFTLHDRFALALKRDTEAHIYRPLAGSSD